jgi:hypothetical protein
LGSSRKGGRGGGGGEKERRGRRVERSGTAAWPAKSTLTLRDEREGMRDVREGMGGWWMTDGPTDWIRDLQIRSWRDRVQYVRSTVSTYSRIPIPYHTD